MRKRGQFFSIDVFVAVAIIGVGLFVLYSSKVTEPSSTQTATLSADLMNGFTSLKMYEVDNPYIIQLIRDGNITNSDNTIIQQIAEFAFYGKNATAKNLTKNITEGRLPLQYAFAVYINGTMIYENRPLDPRSPNLITSKRIVSGVKNSTVFWGPVPAEVRVWR